MKDVCRDIKIEPTLIPVEEDYILNTGANRAAEARLDISARGVWSPFDRTFFDIRVSHPNCLSNGAKPMKKICEDNEKEKKAKYGQRVLNVEKATFTPLVFLTNGMMAEECSRFNKRMTQLIATKRDEKYADVIRHIRTRLRFALLKSTLVAVRGYRGNKGKDQESQMSDISFNLIPKRKEKWFQFLHIQIDHNVI